MGRRGVRWVSLTRDRHGKMRARFRKGAIDTYMQAPYGSDEWWAEYTDLLAGKLRKAEPEPDGGTMAGLISLYYRSPDFLNLSATTKKGYRSVIERLRVEHGHRLVAQMQRKNVMAIMAKRADTPGAANNYRRTIRMLMRFAMALGLRQDDPTVGVKRMKTKEGGFHTWTDEEILQYEKKWGPGTKQRLALYLMLYLAQRRSDVVMIGRQHRKGNAIRVRQQKTGAELWLPIHPKLQVEIDRVEGQMTYLQTDYGRPYTSNGFGNRMREWCDKAGLPMCSSHGLRKAASVRMAEAGCTEKEIMAMTGHRTSAEVSRYTAGANQRKLATQAVARLSNPE